MAGTQKMSDNQESENTFSKVQHYYLVEKHSYKTNTHNQVQVRTGQALNSNRIKCRLPNRNSSSPAVRNAPRAELLAEKANKCDGVKRCFVCCDPDPSLTRVILVTTFKVRNDFRGK